MNLTKRVGFLAGAAALVLTGGSFADTTSQETNQQLRARVADLESRLAAVEKGDNWLSEQRADEVRGLIQDVLADADTRASLLAQGMTAGYDNGAVIASADGNWLMRTNLLMQQRFIINSLDAGVGSTTDDDIWDFETTRARLTFSGNVVSPDWFYKVELEFGAFAVGGVGAGVPSGAAATVQPADIRSIVQFQDAYLGYDYGNGWKVMLGTMKAPLLREELVASQHQLLVERSLVNYYYTAGRVDGIAVDYLGDQFHAVAMVNDGMRTGSTAFGPFSQDNDFAFTARLEWLAQGTWDQFTDFTSPDGDERGVMVGGAIHYQTSEDVALVAGGPKLPDTDVLVLTGDVSAEFGRWNVFGALVYTSVDFTAPAVDVDQTAIVVQGGYYLNDNWELFGRYEWSDFDLVTVPVTEDLSVLTLGATRYFSGHNAKWTTDIAFGLDEVSIAPATLTGFRADDPGQDTQVVIRSQIQIMF